MAFKRHMLATDRFDHAGRCVPASSGSASQDSHAPQWNPGTLGTPGDRKHVASSSFICYVTNHTFIKTITPQPFYGPFSGTTGWAGAKREPLVFMVQGKINRGRHINHPAGSYSIRTKQCPAPPSRYFLTGRMPFLPPNQQCQSTEGNYSTKNRSFWRRSSQPISRYSTEETKSQHTKSKWHKNKIVQAKREKNTQTVKPKQMHKN